MEYGLYAAQPELGFADRLTTNPLFLMGAGVLGADNIGKGLLTGAQMAGQNRQVQLKNILQSRELADKQRRDVMFGEMMAGNPEWARSLPPGAVDLVKMAGPDAGTQSALQMLQAHPALALERQKMGLQVQQMQMEQQQRQFMNPLLRQKMEAEVKALGQRDYEREFMSQLYGRMLQGTQGAQPPAGPAGAPKLLPQSAPGGATPMVPEQGAAVQSNQPQLIQTQTAAPAPQQRAAEETVQVPGIGMVPRSMAEAMQFALSKDRGAVVGEAIKKDDLSKEARNEIDKQEVAATDGLQKIRQIRSSFDPSFLKYSTQAEMWGKSLLAKAGSLAPEDQAGLYKFATFRRDAAANINAAIKANSGATVTEQELRRNLVELPNAGSGIFDGDDAVTFRAKVDRAEETLALGIARKRYLRAQGFKGDIDAAAAQLPIEQMRGLINRRAAAIEADLARSNPTLPKAIIDREVDARVRQEFGI